MHEHFIALQPDHSGSPSQIPKGEAEVVRILKMGRVGSARVRKHKNKYWELDFSFPAGVGIKRFRKYYTAPTTAYREARRISLELRKHGQMANALTHSERWIATECFRLIAPIAGENVPLCLLDIVREHLRRHPLGGLARTINDVCREVVEKKRSTGRSEQHCDGLDYKLRKLVEAVGDKAITSLTQQDLEAELERHPDWRATTVHSAVQSWKIMLNHAIKRGYITENPANRIDLPKIVHEEPLVLSIADVKKLMSACLFGDGLPECRAYLAIGLFAGVRPIREMPYLDWSDINLDAGTLTVRAASAKARVRRIVTMEPNLVAWLRPLARRRGRVLTRPVEELRAAARRFLGFPRWPNDVMRHTFASYYFELYHDEQRTKKQLGHHDDGRVFYHHYCKPVYPSDARAFWSIRPPADVLPCETPGWREAHPEVRLVAA